MGLGSRREGSGGGPEGAALGGVCSLFQPHVRDSGDSLGKQSRLSGAKTVPLPQPGDELKTGESPQTAALSHTRTRMRTHTHIHTGHALPLVAFPMGRWDFWGPWGVRVHLTPSLETAKQRK